MSGCAGSSIDVRGDFLKSSRQNKIIELINRYEIDTQEELGNWLDHAGFPVTQATISRDIRELCLTKIPASGGRQRYAILSEKESGLSDRFARVLQDGMISMDQADNILVIKTVSGMAMAVAAAIDSIGIEEIVGSIAGDDTVMCAIRSAELVDTVIKRLQK